MQTVNASGGVYNLAGLDAFGESGTNAAGPFDYQHTYPTEQFGSGPNATALSFREYDPSTGRMLKRDPMGYDGGINLYAYTQNNPVNDIDPFGLQSGVLAAPWGGSSGLNSAFRNAARAAAATDAAGGGPEDLIGDALATIAASAALANQLIGQPIADRYFGPSTYPSLPPIRLPISQAKTKDEDKTGKPPPNLAPPGASRKSAFRAAKRRNGIPMCQQPRRVYPAKNELGELNGKREYDFGRNIRIREDPPHEYDDPAQNRGPHFNDQLKNHYDFHK